MSLSGHILADASSLRQALSDPYNALSMGIGLLGLALTVVGFGVAIWQLRRTENAAKAGKVASIETLRRIARLAIAIEAAILCRYAAELTLLMRQRSWAAAAMRAADLRSAIAKVRESEDGRALLPKPKWQEMLTQAKFIEDILGAAAIGKDFANDEQRCLETVADLHEILNSIAGRGLNLAQGG